MTKIPSRVRVYYTVRSLTYTCTERGLSSNTTANDLVDVLRTRASGLQLIHKSYQITPHTWSSVLDPLNRNHLQQSSPNHRVNYQQTVTIRGTPYIPESIAAGTCQSRCHIRKFALRALPEITDLEIGKPN